MGQLKSQAFKSAADLVNTLGLPLSDFGMDISSGQLIEFQFTHIPHIAYHMAFY